MNARWMADVGIGERDKEGPELPMQLRAAATTMPRDSHACEGSWSGFASAIAELEAKNRERRRLKTARYRKQQHDKTLQLEQAIQRLQQDVHNLELQKQQVAMGISLRAAPWCVVAEYFRLFRYGYKAPRERDKPHAQLDFLNAVMAPDVIDGPRCGIDAMVESWALAMWCCPDFELHLRCIDNGVDGVVAASSTISFTITTTTLRCGFNCDLADDKGSMGLLGQRIHVRGQHEFHWDEENDRVKMLVSKLDVETALLNLLGSLEDVSRVLKTTFLML